MDLDGREHPAGDVGVAVRYGSDGVFAVGLHDDEAARSVRQRPGKNDLALSIERPQMLQVRWAEFRPKLLGLGAIAADNDK